MDARRVSLDYPEASHWSQHLIFRYAKAYLWWVAKASGGKKAPGAYAGAEHSDIKQTCWNLGHVSLITEDKFWCKTTAGGPLSPGVDM